MPRPDASLERAFRATLYRVQGRPAFTVRVGQPSPALKRWMRAAGAGSAAMLSAWNPDATPRPAVLNRREEARMLRVLRALQPAALRRGRNQDPRGLWPTESSVWVLGLSRQDLIRVGLAFGQRAILYCGPSARPRLHWL